jgi:hypothetical protein
MRVRLMGGCGQVDGRTSPHGSEVERSVAGYISILPIKTLRGRLPLLVLPSDDLNRPIRSRVSQPSDARTLTPTHRPAPSPPPNRPTVRAPDRPATSYPPPPHEPQPAPADRDYLLIQTSLSCAAPSTLAAVVASTSAAPPRSPSRHPPLSLMLALRISGVGTRPSRGPHSSASSPTSPTVSLRRSTSPSLSAAASTSCIGGGGGRRPPPPPHVPHHHRISTNAGPGPLVRHPRQRIQAWAPRHHRTSTNTTSRGHMESNCFDLSVSVLSTL